MRTREHRRLKMRLLSLATCATFVGIAQVDASDTPPPTTAYVGIDTLPLSRAANAIATNVNAPNSYGFRAGGTFVHGRILLEGTERKYEYEHTSDLPNTACNVQTGCATVIGTDPHYRFGVCPSSDPGCVTVIGHTTYENGAPQRGQVYLPALHAQDRDDETHLAFRIPRVKGKIYAGVGLLRRSASYAGYPALTGIGYGISAPPNFSKRLSTYGSIYSYSHLSGKYTGATSVYLGPLSGAHFTLAYSVKTYELGEVYTVPKSALYASIHVGGDQSSARADAPNSTRHTSLGATVGLRF